jgi:hypothetical protein
MNLLKKLIIVMRLFEEGSIGYSSTIWKPILKTALKGGGISSSIVYHVLLLWEILL